MTTDRDGHIDALLAQIRSERDEVDAGKGEPARVLMLVRELADLFSGNIEEVAARMGVPEDDVHAILRGDV